MPRKPHDFAPRDESIGFFTALYRIALYFCLEAIFFLDGGNVGSVAKRLSTADPQDAKNLPLFQRLQKLLPKNRSALQLTSAGCRRFGVSQTLAAPMRKPALDNAIAIQWACICGSCECHRVTRAEILPLLGRDTPPENVAHLVSFFNGSTEPVLLRVYQATSDLRTCMDHVERLIEEAYLKPVLSKWIASRDYGFAILCPTENYVAAVRSAILERGFAEGVFLYVDLGPTSDTLDEAIRQKLNA